MNRLDVKELKRACPMPVLLERMSLGEFAKKSVRSPFREEKNASWGIFEREGKWFFKDQATGDSGDEIKLLALWKGLDAKRDFLAIIKIYAELAGVPLNGDRQQPRAAKPAAKEIRPFDWLTCVAAFTDAEMQQLAQWRGYSPEFGAWLMVKQLIGLRNSNFALPVHDESGVVVGAHYRLPNGTWRYEPRGISTTPIVFGDTKEAAHGFVFESPWDAFAVMDKLGWHKLKGIPETAIVITRGAGNGKLVAGMFGPETLVYAFKQNDETKNGKNAADGWLADVRTHADGKVVQVATPPQHKDVNDWTRAGAPGADIMAAIQDAKPVSVATKFKPGSLAAEYLGTEPTLQRRTIEPSALPPWTDAAEFCATPCPAPPQIIHGILHQGCKMVFGGPSKARKSWVLLDLAVSVATGSPWLNLPTTAARVAFVNFELPTFAIHQRLHAIAKAKQVEFPADQLLIWNLRGHAASFETLLPQLTERMRGHGFGLVILDPSYKLLGQADENSAGDVALLCNSIERLAVESSAAVAFAAHFAKGNASGKESIDRISGSGVFARDPDAILTASTLETPDCYAIEPILRTMPPHAPFAVRWDYPRMRVDETLDPAALKRPKGRTPKIKPTLDEVLALFGDYPDKPREGLMTAVELRGAFRDRGWEDTEVPALRDTLEGQGRLNVWHGPHNTKLCGLPSMVAAHKLNVANAGTVLEQPAMPTKPVRKRKQP